MPNYAVSGLAPADIIEFPGLATGVVDTGSGVAITDLTMDGGPNDVGAGEYRRTLDNSGSLSVERDGEALITVVTFYGPAPAGELGPVTVRSDFVLAQFPFGGPIARIETRVVLAPITSQAPMDVVVPILLGFPVDLDIVSSNGVGGAALAYDLSYETPGPPANFARGDIVDDPSASGLVLAPPAGQTPLTAAALSFALEGFPGAVTAPFTLFEDGPQVIDGVLKFGEQAPYDIHFSVETTTPSLQIDETFMVEVDGAMVPANEVYVLAGPSNLGFIGVFPESIPDSLDGFDFEPGNVLDAIGRTITARGVDEDGFEAGFDLGAGIGENVVSGVTLVVPVDAQVIQSQLRPSQASVFDVEQPVVAIAGQGVLVRNAGRIEGAVENGIGVLLAQSGGTDVNAVENTGEIVTLGDFAPGVLVAGDATELRNDRTVQTFGEQAHGVWAVGAALSITNDASGEILTDGARAIGLKVGVLGTNAMRPSVLGVRAPEIGAFEQAVADELDAEEAAAFLSDSWGTVVNAGLVDTRAPFLARADGAPPDVGAQVQPALLAVLKGGAVVNSGVLRADDYAAVVVGDGTVLRNSGRIETGAVGAAEARTAALADGLSFTRIENTGVIAGDVVFAAPQGALRNSGEVNGALSVGIRNLLSADAGGDFELTVDGGGRLGADPARRHDLSLLGDGGALGDFNLTANGQIVGGVSAVAAMSTVVVGEAGSIHAQDGPALGLIGVARVAIDGDISALDPGVEVAGFLLGDPATLDLTVGSTGSVRGGGNAAVVAVIDGAAKIENAGVIEGIGGADAVRLGVSDDTFVNAGTLRGDVRLFLGADTMVWRDGAAIDGGVVSGDDGEDTLIAEGGALDGSVFLDFEAFRVRGGVTLAGALAVDSATVESGGALALDGVLDGDLSVEDGGVLTGTGVITGALAASGFATIGPGFSPGTLRVEGDAAIAGRILLELGPEGADLIEVAGALDLTGATIEITVSEGVAFATAPPLLRAAAIVGLDAAVVLFNGPGAEGRSLVLDEDGAVAAAPGGNPPTAANDAFATDEDAPLTGDLFADNGSGPDSDPDGDALTLVAVNGVEAAVGSPIVLTSGALLTVNADGTFAYDPNGAFEALDDGAFDVDGFTYTVSDGRDGAATAAASIAIAGVTDMPALNLVLGTDGNDRLVGTDAADLIRPLGGRIDFVEGRGGADVFDFSDSTANGARETRTILDFTPGEDAIAIGEASVVTIRALKSLVVLQLDGEGDLLLIRGISDAADIAFA